MAHPEQRAFVVAVRAVHPDYFAGGRICEIGSRDVNGSIRELFHDSIQYLGVDYEPGPGVDRVGMAHTSLAGCRSQFDVVVTCEALEHDPAWRATLATAVRILKPGGLFVATMASPKRPRHGTTDSNDGAAFGPDPDYYRGLAAEDLSPILSPALFPMSIRSGCDGLDTYVCGFRS